MLSLRILVVSTLLGRICATKGAKKLDGSWKGRSEAKNKTIKGIMSKAGIAEVSPCVCGRWWNLVHRWRGRP